MEKRLLAILTVGLLLTGCAEVEVGSNIWTDYNANHEEYHVVYAMSEHSFYTDGSITANMLYEDFKERQEVRED